MKWNNALSGLIMMLGIASHEIQAFTNSNARVGFQRNSIAYPHFVGAVGDDLPDPENENSGAEITDEMKQRIREQNEDESQGGSRFKEMMAKAQSAQQSRASSAIGGPPMNPYANAPIDNPQPAAAADIQNMSTQEQAAMFRAIMMQGQQQDPQPPARYKNDGRKVGRNRDADAIQNTSDLYFAQLKRDSTVRTMARIRGEDEKANAVFEDESIEKLKDLMYDNPYLKDHKEKEKQMLDDSMGEIIAIKQAEARSQAMDKTSSGINYRQKLMERKNIKANRGQVNLSPPQPIQASAPPPQQPVNVQQPRPIQQTTTIAPPVAAQPPSTISVQPPPPPVAQPPPSPASKAAATTITGQELDTALQCVDGASEMYFNSPSQMKNVVLVSLRAAILSAVKTFDSYAGGPYTGIIQPGPPTTVEEVETALNFLSGSSKMYRNCDPGLKDGAMNNVRAGLLAALYLCDNYIAENGIVH